MFPAFLLRRAAPCCYLRSLLCAACASQPPTLALWPTLALCKSVRLATAVQQAMAVRLHHASHPGEARELTVLCLRAG